MSIAKISPLDEWEQKHYRPREVEVERVKDKMEFGIFEGQREALSGGKVEQMKGRMRWVGVSENHTGQLPLTVFLIKLRLNYAPSQNTKIRWIHIIALCCLKQWMVHVSVSQIVCEGGNFFFFLIF